VDWVRLALSLERDVSHRAEVALPAGIRLTTWQEWGDSAGHRGCIYELNNSCSADILDRGEFFTFEEYEPLRFEAPGTRADGLVLAFDEADVVGLCQLTCPPGRRWAFIEMTGVLPEYRRRRIATSTKLQALRAARSWSCAEVRTFHHLDNTAIITANRSLGFHGAGYDL
jgi:GNAT superfamily N-acetyltransferase